MIGVELHGSGSATFQRTFSVALQHSGRLRSSHTPSPRAPRQAGQLSAKVGFASIKSVTETTNVRMDGYRLGGWMNECNLKWSLAGCQLLIHFRLDHRRPP